MKSLSWIEEENRRAEIAQRVEIARVQQERRDKEKAIVRQAIQKLTQEEIAAFKWVIEDATCGYGSPDSIWK